LKSLDAGLKSAPAFRQPNASALTSACDAPAGEGMKDTGTGITALPPLSGCGISRRELAIRRGEENFPACKALKTHETGKSSPAPLRKARSGLGRADELGAGAADSRRI
jgi:hypothetical protein